MLYFKKISSHRYFFFCRKIFLSGHSAGAHLCAMVFASPWFGNLPNETKSLFAGVFYFAGVYDLRWSTCVLVCFSWLLDHGIYLKLWREKYNVKLRKFTKWHSVLSRLESNWLIGEVAVELFVDIESPIKGITWTPKCDQPQISRQLRVM